VVNDALTLASPLSGTVVGGANQAVAVAISPLIAGVNSTGSCAVSFYLAPVANPGNRTYVGCGTLSGGQIGGSINTGAVANGPNDLEIYLYLPDLYSGSYDYYYYSAGVLDVENAPALLTTPSASPNPFTPNGDGANDQLAVT